MTDQRGATIGRANTNGESEEVEDRLAIVGKDDGEDNRENCEVHSGKIAAAGDDQGEDGGR